jgi:DNA-binding LacI/PurR family transcriptional regulator
MHWERSVATTADVARKPGVSVSTAWQVLNGARRGASGPAPPTEAAIEWFGDRLNIMAHGLKAASTTSIVTAIRKRGLRMPKDASVVDFDDFGWANHFGPRLRLVAQPSPDIGRRADLLLRERITVPPRSGRAIDLDAAIIGRASCSRPT